MSKTKGFPSSLSDESNEKWILHLYVAGMTSTTKQAIKNLERICEKHLANSYSIEMIDLREHPEAAEEDQIFAVPTLVRKSPEPVRKIIGDFSNTNKVLKALDVPG